MPKKPSIKLPPLNLGNETTGQRIARIRKERGYTQIELAERIGTIQTLVSEYERNKLRLNSEMVARFALALEVTSDELIGLKHRTKNEKKPSRKIARRLELIEKLPPAKQTVLLKTIDTFIKGVGV